MKKKNKKFKSAVFITALSVILSITALTSLAKTGVYASNPEISDTESGYTYKTSLFVSASVEEKTLASRSEGSAEFSSAKKDGVTASSSSQEIAAADVGVAAANANGSEATPEASDKSGTEDNNAQNDTGITDAKDAPATNDTAASGEAKSAEENVFTQIYGYITYYAGDIFGALAFIVSLILSFICKNKLMPTISKSAGDIENQLKKLGETTSKKLEEAKEESEEARKCVLELQSALERAAAATECALKSVENCDELARQREKVKLVISSQIDMLYDIFMSSSLPQYQKESVGNRITEMKEMLAKDE